MVQAGAQFRTNGVIFQHSHHGTCSGSLEGIEEAGHGHGDEPDVEQSRLCCRGCQLCSICVHVCEGRDVEIPLEQTSGRLTFLGHFVDILGAQMMSFDIIAVAA